MAGLSDLLQSGSLSYANPTPSSVAARRALAEQLLKGSVNNSMSPLGALAQTLGGSFSGYENKQATNDERLGAEGASTAYADALKGGDPTMEGLTGLASNPWLNQGQSGVVSALLGQEMQQNDPAHQLDMKYKQAQLDALGAKPGQPLINVGDGVLYDPNTKEWITQPAPDGGQPSIDPDTAKAEGNLRTEYNGINTVKDFGLQTQAYQRVLDSAKDASPAGDLALIFNYMKVLDPGSTVREGEFATAQNSGSLPEQIWSQYNKIMTGERLAPEIRRDFVERAGQLYQGAAGLQQGTNERYTDIANQYGYEPSRIVAGIPQIGVLDPEFDVTEYLDPETGEQWKPIPLTEAGADAEYEALPSGTMFMGPDGQVRKKP